MSEKTLAEIQAERKAAIRALADEAVAADQATHSSDVPHVQWASNDWRDPMHEAVVSGVLAPVPGIESQDVIVEEEPKEEPKKAARGKAKAEEKDADAE